MLHHEYRVVEDGVAIARYMREGDLPSDVTALFMSLSSPRRQGTTESASRVDLPRSHGTRAAARTKRPISRW